MPQIREIIAEAGLSDDEHAVDNSKWLVANQIPPYTGKSAVSDRSARDYRTICRPII